MLLRDGAEPWKDASSRDGFRSRDTWVLRDGKAQGQIDRVTNADTPCYEHLPHAESVVAHLERRAGIQEVKPIVSRPA